MVTVPHPSHFSSAELGGHWGYNDEKSDNYQNVTNTVIAGAFPEFIAGQNCGCAADLYVVAYTVIAALPVITVPLGSRPCFAPPATNGVLVADIVTDAFFNGIIDQATEGCAGRAAFLQALIFHTQFGRIGSEDDSKHFCYIEEIDAPSRDYCEEGNTQYPCAPNKGYYSRGRFRSSIGFDGLKKLEIVASDPVMSFRVPLWYWMNRMHSIITSSQGFGPTTRAINGQLECDGANHNIVTARVQYYIELCNLLGVFSQR
ncbi:LOW QUALITY PROTEIN: hypothetical protein LguiA_029040 [Lonicera macranthoides]